MITTKQTINAETFQPEIHIFEDDVFQFALHLEVAQDHVAFYGSKEGERYCRDYYKRLHPNKAEFVDKAFDFLLKE